MAITKKELEDYPDMIAEIDELTRRINKSRKEIVTDVVSGSSAEFPYTTHPMSIHGVALDETLVERKKKLREKLKKQTEEIEAFIDSLPTSKHRRIVRMRVLDGMTWDSIACKIEGDYTAKSVSQRYYRILKDYKIN